MSLPSDQPLNLSETSARASCAAQPCVSVLPSSVTSGPSPPASAAWNFFGASSQGMYCTTTSVSGCFFLNSASTLSRNLVWASPPSPIIHTVSLLLSAALSSSPEPPHAVSTNAADATMAVTGASRFHLFTPYLPQGRLALTFSAAP